jgi:hypothetical protein
VPGLGVRLACDNLATHKTAMIQDWLALCYAKTRRMA